ncbi:putative MFS transporter, AGZA family, xanthine/uracil permease [Roseomonas rosea]|uniref:Putative MFS transporter, AGZA family, xanthine/uracil permease n=1 Tax=Muricoccus roseus TaxID=198092 RepID=A0A1M6QD64_9PROT|nr:NCS2 family permease [Roseomonas rosea]SHK18060.1 putative MFS transporter, AGZA family, xanthine/uracil permease [Roseomonas rosea]
MDRLFSLTENGTTPRRELMAGLTTFLAMAYIIVVNPRILAAAGIDPGAAFVATCLAAAIGCALMGLLANFPIALAPGMGVNAYFAFAVVGQAGASWQVALGAVFLSGVIFLFVSLAGFREWLINGIPLSLKLGIAAGIGLLLGLIGLQNLGMVVDHPATLVTLGNLGSPPVLIGSAGFILIAALSARRVPGAIIIGVLVTALAGIPLGLTRFEGFVAAPPSIAPTLLQMDLAGAFSLAMASVVFTFFVADLLNNAGTLIATTHRAGLMRPDGSVPRLGRALVADSGGAMIGAALGTSPTVSYIESAAGIQAGGRTGLTALTVGALFLLALFFSPVATAIPAFATAPALVFVACLMAESLKDLDWGDMTEYLPAILGAMAMPFTFSIGTGIGIAFTAYALIKLAAGRPGEVHGAVWVLAILSALQLALS